MGSLSGGGLDRIYDNTDGIEAQLAAIQSALTTGSPISGSVSTELPDPAILADSTSNPTTVSVGSFAHWFNGVTWDRARGTITDGVLVNLGANNDITGTVTANAGTNLNTSLLALESGGNLAGIATSLAIIDDWDESDRAKVNIIAGQAGVTAGAGSVSTNTPRITLASDDPAVSSLSSINGKFTAAAAVADNASNPTTTTVYAIPMVQNSIGNTERIKGVTSTFNSDSVGIQANGMVGQFDDASITSVTENNFGVARMSGNRNLYVRIRDDAGNERGLNIDSNGELGISAIRSALPAGTNAIGKLSANSGVDIGDVDVTSAVITGGGVADDGTTPGNPIMVGGRAVETDGTDPTSVSAEDDVAIFRTDRNRRLLVNVGHPNAWSVNENHSSAQTNNTLKAAPGANLSLYITDIIISNGAVAGNVKLVEDESGTPVDIFGPYYFAINGGMSHKFTTPKRLTANKSLGFTSVTSTTHTISVNGYTAP